MCSLYSQKNAAQSRTRRHATLRINEALGPAVRHDAVVLDQGDVGSASESDAGGTKLGDGGRLVKGQKSYMGPLLADSTSSRSVGPVGDDHLSRRSAALERLEALAEVREAVHGGDNDREIRLGHRR